MADNAPGSEQQNPKRVSRANGQLPWRRDSVILQRLPVVERLHLAGRPNTHIAAHLGVDEGTIRNDIKRLQELWLEQTKAEQAEMRAAVVAELNDTRKRAIAAAEFDEFCERAVLFDDPTMPDYEMQRLGLDSNLRVSRDEKGSATFRGQKAQSLNVARQSTMDKAKVLGLIVEKTEVSGKDGGALVLTLTGVDLERV